jgi:RND family efflux transporter MFP subunit
MEEITMKSTLLIIACFLSSAVVFGSAAHAGSASEAVTKMSDGNAKALAAPKDPGVDKSKTSSVETKDKYDARGVVVPNAEVTLAAGVSAKIDQLPFKAGEKFRKGDLLVGFNCARQQADLRGAKASLGKVSSFYQGKKRLKARGAAGGQEVREAAADVATATATVDGLREIITLCNISAPFNGRVVERHAETFEIPATSAPILTVVDDSALELDLIVPSKWLRWVKTGSTFDFAVDELGKSYKARVARLGAKVDAVSQTIRLTGSFVTRPGTVLAGMSGTAKFAPPTN